MSITFPGSVTGSAQTGFTTPGYTTSVDNAPAVNAKQVAVTALTGTQVGVRAHSLSDPFTIAAFRPLSYAMLGKPHPVTGLVSNVPRNTTKIIVRKGVIPAINQLVVPAVFRLEMDIPAGAETYDVANVRAGLSALIGVLTAVSAGLGDTLNNGVM